MIKQLIQNMLACSTFIVFGLSGGYGQTDTAELNEYNSMNFKDLLKVKMVSASKKSEYLFDAPVSASVVTKEDIRRAGCTSIMEALRLMPGLIVREQSNGNYDIHLRGMDNAPPNTAFDVSSNTTTLVMIDDRPVYNYLKGGTFWETLPVDINDVERIEVVRGPASALYGPNAVNGVIHIITREVQKPGLYAEVNSQQGNYNTFINNASLGYKFNKWSIIASGNYQHRERSQTSYYEISSDKWVDPSQYLIDIYNDTMKNFGERYPDPRLAQEKYAGNIYLTYNPQKKIHFDVDAGTQHTLVQHVVSENVTTPFSTFHSDNRYLRFRATIRGLTAQYAWQAGTQDIMLSPGYKYNYYTADGNLEYAWTIGKLSVKPGISYRSATYDDTKYSDIINKTGLFNNKGLLTQGSVSLRTEYKVLRDKLRLIAALRADKFNYPDTTYLSYQFAGTYTPNKKNLFRATYSRAPRSPFIFDTYVDQAVAYYPSGFREFTKIVLEGSKNTRLLTSDMFEIGYRGKLTSSLEIDVEVFDTYAKNFRTFVMNARYRETSGSNTIYTRPIVSQNLPLEFHQQGITLSLGYNKYKLYVKSFVTFQRTTLKNYSEYMNAPGDIPTIDNNFDPANNNIYSGMGTETKHTSTPSIFGGATVNYALGSKINCNLNAYYYTSQTFYHMSNRVFRDGVRGVDHINGKLILNAKVSYAPVKGLSVFCSGKNLLNDASREFFRSDKVPFQLLAGIHYEF